MVVDGGGGLTKPARCLFFFCSSMFLCASFPLSALFQWFTEGVDVVDGRDESNESSSLKKSWVHKFSRFAKPLLLEGFNLALV